MYNNNTITKRYINDSLQDIHVGHLGNVHVLVNERNIRIFLRIWSYKLQLLSPIRTILHTVKKDCDINVLIPHNNLSVYVCFSR